MNWQVNRATPAVVITHKCQRAWHSVYQHIPRMPPPSLQDFARVQAFRLWKCSPSVRYRMIRRQNPLRLYSFDGHHFLVQTQRGSGCSPRANQAVAPLTASMEPTDHRFPSHGSSRLSRCWLKQSQLKLSSFLGPNLDCVRYSHAWKPVNCVFLWVPNHESGDYSVHR